MSIDNLFLEQHFMLRVNRGMGLQNVKLMHVEEGTGNAKLRSFSRICGFHPCACLLA